MGICYWDARMLWEARLRGASFKDTVTVGHQFLYLHPSEVKFFRNAFKANFPNLTAKSFDNYKFGDYSDEFLRELLSVKNLSIIDASGYENADIIQDLNEPIPENLRNRFDAVIDSGTLEHIFNFPVAIANLMKLVKVGGNVFITTPANNLCGHGFYQFSPELMFRIFTEENGFELNRIVMFEAKFPGIELSSNRKAYEVTDPEKVRSRVGIMSKSAVTMMVEAKKVSDAALFARVPLQSDYVALWNEGENKSQPAGAKKILKRIFENLPFFLQKRIIGYREKRQFSFSNRQFYKKL